MSERDPVHLIERTRNHAPVWEKDAPAYCEASGVPLVTYPVACERQQRASEINRAGMAMLRSGPLANNPLYVCSMCTRPTEAYTYDGPRSRCCHAVAKVYVPKADDARLAVMAEAQRVEEELRSEA